MLGLCALVSGVYAAWLWWRASKVVVVPAWALDIEVDPDRNIMGWVVGQMTAFKRAGDLNAKAALWTAIAVLSGSLGSLLPFALRIGVSVRAHL